MHSHACGHSHGAAAVSSPTPPPLSTADAGDASRRAAALGLALAHLLGGDAAACIAVCGDVIARAPREALPWMLRGRAFASLGGGCGARGALLQAELHFDRVVSLTRATVARRGGSVAGRDLPGSVEHAADALVVETLRASRCSGSGVEGGCGGRSTSGGSVCGGGGGDDSGVPSLQEEFPASALTMAVAAASAATGAPPHALVALVARLYGRDALLGDVAAAGGASAVGAPSKEVALSSAPAALGARALAAKSLCARALASAPAAEAPCALEATWVALLRRRGEGGLGAAAEVFARDAAALGSEGSLGAAVAVAAAAAVAATVGGDSECAPASLAAAAAAAGGLQPPGGLTARSPWALLLFAAECCRASAAASGGVVSGSTTRRRAAASALTTLATAAAALAQPPARCDSAARALRAAAAASAAGAALLGGVA